MIFFIKDRAELKPSYLEFCMGIYFQGPTSSLILQRPELLSQGYLADLIVAKQMFVFFLPEMCVDGPQQLLYRNIADKAYSAGKQLKVMGYNTPNEVSATF